MGLPVSQRRILERIENGLRGSDPRLAALFCLFSRLNRDQAMPPAELVRGRVTAALAALSGRLAALRRWFLSPRRTRLRTALFFPVAMGLVAAAVLVGSSFPDNTRCAPAAHASRVAHASDRAKRTRLTCKPTASNPVIIAR